MRPKEVCCGNFCERFYYPDKRKVQLASHFPFLPVLNVKVMPGGAAAILQPEGNKQDKGNTKIEDPAGHQWLMTVILTTQGEEIRKIEVQSQPRQIVCKTLSRKKKSITKKGWWSGSRY
jgi:hypothetical protein